MKTSEENLMGRERAGERGGSKVTLVIVLTVLALGAFAGFNYVPNAYADNSIKQELQTIATNAVILPAATTNGQNINWANAELGRLATTWEIPKADFKAEMAGPAVRTSIKHHRSVPILPLGIYNYEYDLVFSATSAGYVNK
jgi:hypothetical protein